MKHILIIAAGLFCLNCTLHAQSSSNHIFQVMNLAVSPRVASFGGNFLPLQDKDVLLALHNPATIDTDLHNALGFTFLNYPAGINAGNVVYGRTFERYGSFVGGIRYLNYGTFDRTDDAGNAGGSFTASDIVITAGWGRSIFRDIRMGAALNVMISDYDVWSSVALGVDVSGHYHSPSGLFDASLVVRNVGRQIIRFGDENEPLPFEVAAGISRKLKHAPVRFYVLLNTLNQWDLTYNDPLNPDYTVDPITGKVIEESKTVDFLDKAMRHVTGGIELMPGNLLRVRLGYDYRTRQESGVQTKMGLAGFTWGLGLKLGKYQFDFSRSRQHLAGAPNYFSIRTVLGG
ncbi:MAG TPA: type IX secretion system protein PorQ [Bacteroidales bacterium]|nr:type IX secretion system protein PorQ [Bacteroidales bacterium]HRZ49098.1 type IX secretion system protein PorQ [Bacteroidales bacterium]